jgi:cytochrome oxidase Cu insertion factor (SCO1/SenC/PrrC family)
MKLKYTFLLWLSLLFIASLTFGQAKNIVISGSIDTSLMRLFECNKLHITLKETTNSNSGGKSIDVPVQINGFYSIVLNSPDRFNYLTFEMFDKGQNQYVNIGMREKYRYLTQAYLFEEGDSISIDIRKLGILVFSGKGSVKLNCQDQIYNTDSKINSGPVYRVNELYNSVGFERGLLLENNMIESITKMKLDILNSYTGFSKEVYNRIYLDILAATEYPMLINLSSIRTIYRPEISEDLITQKFFEKYTNKNNTVGIDSLYMEKSAYYAELLFEKELNRFKLYNTNASSTKGISFKDVYHSIVLRYHGKLRDKLIFICFQRMNVLNATAISIYVEEALKLIEDETYKALLVNWKDHQIQAYPFELTDSTGKIHKLSDYKNKVVVIDFWYTGCIWCIKLAESMRPVLQEYKKNKDVVFITVSIDKNKDMWLSSLRDGKYTSPENVNLYTNGMGRIHPLIENYGITAFPRQIIIGKDNKLINSNPPRVDIAIANKDKIIEIIDGALEFK